MTRDESGFTVIELLVSLALLSLMAIYALNALALNSKMKAVGKTVESKVEVTAVLRQFHDEITSLIPSYVRGSDGQPLLLFEGTQNTISYVLTTDGTRETGGLFRVVWSIDKDHLLVVERSLLRVGPASVTPIVALKDVFEIKFSYDGAPNWKEQNKLPKVIGMTLETMNENSFKVETLATIASVP